MDGVLYLTGRDIAALSVSPGRLRAALARAFRLHAEGRTHVEPKLTVAIAPGHFFQSLCAASPDLSFAATKWVGVAAENAARGLAGVNGLVILSDFATGVPAASRVTCRVKASIDARHGPDVELSRALPQRLDPRIVR